MEEEGIKQEGQTLLSRLDAAELGFHEERMSLVSRARDLVKN